MTPSRTFRVLFLGSMLGSMAVVILWAGWIGWRRWPEWRAVREIRVAVEANEPARFLDAIEQVDSLGVADAAADEIAPLRQHPDPRVRMYAVMARTVLRPRGPDEAKELIELFDDSDEDIAVRRAAAICLGVFGEQARQAVPSLKRAIMDNDDPRRNVVLIAICQLEDDIIGPLPPMKDYELEILRSKDHRWPQSDLTRGELASLVVFFSDETAYGHMIGF